MYKGGHVGISVVVWLFPIFSADGFTAALRRTAASSALLCSARSDVKLHTDDTNATQSHF